MVGSLVERIVSGGQTGVDRAALDTALEQGIPCGGWCPKGRRAEDGVIDPRYPLEETPSEKYAQRTEWNVRDSDATLILTKGVLRGGTLYTVQLAERMGKPHRAVNLLDPLPPSTVRQWLIQHRIKVLNVAGPRESTGAGIYAPAKLFLKKVLVP